MSSSDLKPSKPDSDFPQNQVVPQQQSDSAIDTKSEDVSADQQGEEKEEKDEEEEGECGFCLFMKAGGCRDSFIDWEKCIDEAEKNKENVVDKCVEVTAMLKNCMEAHSNYYEPILSVEKAAEQQFADELEKEAAAAAEQDADRSDSKAKEELKDSGMEVASMGK